MRRLRWSREAREQYDAWLTYLANLDQDLARRGGRGVDLRGLKLAERRSDGRPSRWAGLREVSLKSWRKLLVYEVADADVVIIAFYDTRQDLSVVSPKTE